MSRLIYATHIVCDWPGCRAEIDCPAPSGASVALPDNSGWAVFIAGLQRCDGGYMADFCSIHAARPIGELAELLNAGKKP